MARSIPVIQWFLLVSAMIGTRVATRIWQERRRHNSSPHPHAYVENVLIVGVSHLTELFLESVAEYASKRVDVVGILSEERELRGRLLSFHKVLGTPEELPRVMAQLEVHGVTLERIVVMQPFEQLSPLARDALLDVERASSVRVDWITELLGLTVDRGRNDEQTQIPQRASPQPAPSEAVSPGFPSSHVALKRAFDILRGHLIERCASPLDRCCCSPRGH